MNDFSDKEKLSEIEREIKFRQFVYAKKVKDNSMTPRAAARGIRIMMAIADDYRKALTEGDLFWGRK